MSNQPKSPYFHQQGNSMELRIPLDRQQQKAVCQFIKAVPEDESTFALFVAESGFGILDDPAEPYNEIGWNYCNYIETTPQSRFDTLTRLHKLGWVSDSDLSGAHKEADAWTRAGCPRLPGAWGNLAEDIREAIKKGERETGEMKRLRALLAEIEGNIGIEATGASFGGAIGYGSSI